MMRGPAVVVARTVLFASMCLFSRAAFANSLNVYLQPNIENSWSISSAPLKAWGPLIGLYAPRYIEIEQDLTVRNIAFRNVKQFFAVLSSQDKVLYCAVKDKNLAKAIDKFDAQLMRQRPCIYDRNNDGLLDSVFFAYDKNIDQIGGRPIPFEDIDVPLSYHLIDRKNTLPFSYRQMSFEGNIKDISHVKLFVDSLYAPVYSASSFSKSFQCHLQDDVCVFEIYSMKIELKKLSESNVEIRVSKTDDRYYLNGSFDGVDLPGALQ